MTSVLPFLKMAVKKQKCCFLNKKYSDSLGGSNTRRKVCRKRKLADYFFTLCADTLNWVVLKGLGHTGQQTESLQKLFPLANIM